jgi:hypothetical protein
MFVLLFMCYILAQPEMLFFDHLVCTGRFGSSPRSRRNTRIRETASNQTQPKNAKLKKGPTKRWGLSFCYDAQNDLLATNLLAQCDFMCHMTSYSFYGAKFPKYSENLWGTKLTLEVKLLILSKWHLASSKLLISSRVGRIAPWLVWEEGRIEL